MGEGRKRDLSLGSHLARADHTRGAVDRRAIGLEGALGRSTRAPLRQPYPDARRTPLRVPSAPRLQRAQCGARIEVTLSAGTRPGPYDPPSPLLRQGFGGLWRTSD